MSQRTIHHIAAEADDARITIGELCRHAGVTERTFYAIKSGQTQPRPATLRKLELGFSRAKKARKQVDSSFAERNVYLLCVYTVASRMNVPPEEVLAHDPARRATSDASWIRAAKIRRTALYIANCVTGMRQADAARAAGMTRAGVHYAMKDLEDDRDDPQLEAFLSDIERVFA